MNTPSKDWEWIDFETTPRIDLEPTKKAISNLILDSDNPHFTMNLREELLALGIVNDEKECEDIIIWVKRLNAEQKEHYKALIKDIYTIWVLKIILETFKRLNGIVSKKEN